MSIICKICRTEFPKIIPWQHLKTHNVTSKEYKQQHGPLMSEFTLDKLSKRIPHNKGKKITDPYQLSKIREAVLKREERYKKGILVKRGGKSWSEEEKKHLSEKTKEYAKNNCEEIKQRAVKALQTKIKNKIPFGGFRGKKHTQETRQKISLKSKETNRKKSAESHKNILIRLESADLGIKNSVEEKIFSLQCLKCSHEFTFSKQYFMGVKFKQSICPVCSPRSMEKKSKDEKELYEIVKSLFPTAISGYREHYHSPEIDIYIPDLKIGFEFDGLFWHSESTLLNNGKSPLSSFEKYNYYKQKNIRVYYIFEDEWKTNRSIVISRVKNILGKTSNRIFARHCEVKVIDSKTASEFCKKNHIMGTGRSNVRLGLYYKGSLISVMTFTKNNISRKLKNIWEINRFASLCDYVVVGGANKLFNYFIKTEAPETVVSYADTRWSDGLMYEKLGFVKKSEGTPGYWYFLPNSEKRIHRFSLRKNSTDDQSLTEYENRSNQGYLRIWDCGSSKWVWSKS